jgi:DNA polymerase III subunit delta
LRLGTRNAVSVCEALLAEPVLEAFILLEAGELRSGHALRTLCENARNALSIVCYADESNDIAAVISGMVELAGKAVDPDALELLSETLGSDRAVTRSEISKLLLYVGDRSTISVDDVTAILVDSSRIEPSAAIDAAFSGLVADVEPVTRRVLQDGMDAGVLLGMAYRHALSLVALIEMRRDGLQLRDAAKRQGIHFRRESQIARQLVLWSEDRLISTASQIGQSVADCRKSGPLSSAVGIRSLWNVSLAAKRAL